MMAGLETMIYPEPGGKNYLNLFILIAIGITTICAGIGWGTYCFNKDFFGDIFSAVTAWFSGLAFAGVIITILQQKADLELTKQELKTQNNTLKKQRFENTFFNLLTQHNRIIESIFFQEKGSSNREKIFDAFRVAHGILIGQANNYAKENNIVLDQEYSTLTEVETERILNLLVRPWYDQNPHNFHMYFQSLRRILKFVHRSELLDGSKERIMYATLVKDQISYYEKAIILYSLWQPHPWLHGLTYYVKEYGILNGIEKESLITSKDKTLFDKWATATEPTD